MWEATASTTRRNGGPFRGLISTGTECLSATLHLNTIQQKYFCFTLKSPSSIWKVSLFLAHIESKETLQQWHPYDLRSHFDLRRGGQHRGLHRLFAVAQRCARARFRQPRPYPGDRTRPRRQGDRAAVHQL